MFVLFVWNDSDKFFDFVVYFIMVFIIMELMVVDDDN